MSHIVLQGSAALESGERKNRVVADRGRDYSPYRTQVAVFGRRLKDGLYDRSC